MGPLLFIIYINDIDDQINSRLLKFADDTKIYFKVNSPENIERLREDLCKLVSWSKEWQMLFNIEHWKYENRLAYLQLPRLDMRRVRCDLIDTFKIMNSICTQ